MNWRPWLSDWLNRWTGRESSDPEHLRRGRLGENAAKAHLQSAGLKFITSNFRDAHAGRGEIDLIFRDADCLAFVEVKTRTRGQWTRPAAAVNREKRRLMSATAAAYVRKLKTRDVRWRFDIVEVLLENGEIHEIRHLPNAFPGDDRYRFL